jgi:hypothetical protein
MNSEQVRIRGKLGATIKHRPSDKAAADELRLQLKESRLAEYIAKVVNEAPPLTPEQRDKLATLLRGAA